MISDIRDIFIKLKVSEDDYPYTPLIGTEGK
jgi:hypothetical protein